MYFHLCYCTCLISSTVTFLSNYVLLQQNVPMDMSMKKKTNFTYLMMLLLNGMGIHFDIRHKQPCETTS